MTNKWIEDKRKDLIDIVNMPSGTENKRLKKLRELALEVGASHQSTERLKPARTANEGELVFNIQTALQTASMLNTCKAATRAWIVALISALASVVSAGAAWMAFLIIE